MNWTNKVVMSVCLAAITVGGVDQAFAQQQHADTIVKRPKTGIFNDPSRGSLGTNCFGYISSSDAYADPTLYTATCSNGSVHWAWRDATDYYPSQITLHGRGRDARASYQGYIKKTINGFNKNYTVVRNDGDDMDIIVGPAVVGAPTIRIKGGDFVAITSYPDPNTGAPIGIVAANLGPNRPPKLFNDVNENKMGRVVKEAPAASSSALEYDVRTDKDGSQILIHNVNGQKTEYHLYRFYPKDPAYANLIPQLRQAYEDYKSLPGINGDFVGINAADPNDYRHFSFLNGSNTPVMNNLVTKEDFIMPSNIKVADKSTGVKNQ